jgi:hypothetical protein
MKNFKGFALGLVLGLGLAFSGIAFAQNATGTDQKKEGESCCAMMPDCCKGDSCDMKDNKDRSAKHEGHEGCCCCGDSCDMKMKHDSTEKPKN